MFTVKVSTQHGQALPASTPKSNEQEIGPLAVDEVVFEATQVRMCRDGRLQAAEVGEGSGIVEVRSLGEMNDDPVGHLYCDTETGQIVYPIRAVAKGGVDIIMFVMNRNGATVAKYYL